MLVLLLGVLTTCLPALTAGRVEPQRALRNE